VAQVLIVGILPYCMALMAADSVRRCRYSELIREGSEVEHELRKVGTSAAYLKFLHHKRRIRARNFK